MADPKYAMTVSLNVLEDLGINLYSNVSAVLSEAVANAWDADAKKVEIKLEADKITITDDGHGMDETDINNRYLHIGFKRREHADLKVTPKYKRPVMGRKGIGKLSLFSIADTIKMQTGKNGDCNGFVMSGTKIEKFLKDEGKAGSKSGNYHPDELPEDEITLKEIGTEITLTDLKKKRIKQSGAALRKRLARRFSIIGEEHNFSVIVDGEPIKVTDRDFHHKIQYIWHYGPNGCENKKLCKKIEKDEEREDIAPHVEVDEKTGEPELIDAYFVEGWIGTVKEAGELKDKDDNLNKIVVMVRGKLAQEDILEDFVEGGLYTKYLMGEIHADFLDRDELKDIATTSRQEIIKDDPRYVALKNWIEIELKLIQSKWTDWRNEAGTDEALEIPAIKEWFGELKGDDKKHAKSLFGKINQLKLDTVEQRKELFKYSVLAFENLKYKRNLEALENISPENFAVVSEILANFDDLEATMFHKIITERLGVIEKLYKETEDNVLEKVIQEHIYKYLWLLDPSWDRHTETPSMEQSVKTAFEDIGADLNEEEREGRVDIRYKKSSGKHIIIELKRADRRLWTHEILAQVDKYREALRKLLTEAGRGREPIEVVCIVGKELKDWTDETLREESTKTLEAKNIRTVLYRELIEDAYNSYKAFLEKRKEAGRISELIRRIDEET